MVIISITGFKVISIFLLRVQIRVRERETRCFILQKESENVKEMFVKVSTKDTYFARVIYIP